MDLNLSTEQTQLKDSVERYLASTYGSLEARERHRTNKEGFDPKGWQALADMGLLGIPFTEEDGGFGGDAVATMIVMEAVGKYLALEPYMASVVLGGGALRLAGNSAQKALHLPGLIEGSNRLAFAYVERQSRYDLFDVATSAVASEGGYVMNGRKNVVLNGDSADVLVVSARTSGARRDRNGISLFLVPVATPGVQVQGVPAQDGTRCADVTFSDVRLDGPALLGDEGAGLGALERVLEFGVAALAAEAVGAMEALVNLTVDYLKVRKQFGVTIGSFQALQHKAADMLIMLEQARSMAMYGAMMVDGADAEERRVAIAAVKVQVNRSARFIGQTAVQLHGGIGMTAEYIGAHYFKRLTMIEAQFGDLAHHLERLSTAGGIIPVGEVI